MRALPAVVLLLVGCGGELPVCSDAPLAGGCERVEGTWALEMSSAPRCGDSTFDGPLTLTRNDGQLSGTLGSMKLSGQLFESGQLKLYSSEETIPFSIGASYAGRELRGSIDFQREGSDCNSHWAFVGTRR